MISNPGVPSGLAAAIDQKNANKKLIADAKAAEAAKATQGSLDDEQSTNAKKIEEKRMRKKRHKRLLNKNKKTYQQ